ncbi:hypothetical protein DMH25_42880 [Streptomyces sp. WAC 01325]|nr:hypothetical protein DMH25_42880 [Streptomyces sp. WAC 01325]
MAGREDEVVVLDSCTEFVLLRLGGGQSKSDLPRLSVRADGSSEAVIAFEELIYRLDQLISQGWLMQDEHAAVPVEEQHRVCWMRHRLPF